MDRAKPKEVSMSGAKQFSISLGGGRGASHRGSPREGKGGLRANGRPEISTLSGQEKEKGLEGGSASEGEEGAGGGEAITPEKGEPCGWELGKNLRQGKKCLVQEKLRGELRYYPEGLEPHLGTRGGRENSSIGRQILRRDGILSKQDGFTKPFRILSEKSKKPLHKRGSNREGNLNDW